MSVNMLRVAAPEALPWARPIPFTAARVFSRFCHAYASRGPQTRMHSHRKFEPRSPGEARRPP